MAYGAILGQKPDLSAYENSVQLTTTGSSTYTLTLPDGTDVVSGVSEALGLPNTFTQMQIVSYVGTGTYGESNPCSITADFPIEIIIYLGRDSGTNIQDGFVSTGPVMLNSRLTFDYKSNVGFNGTSNTRGKKSLDSHTFYWFSTTSSTNQLSSSGYTYYFLCLG